MRSGYGIRENWFSTRSMIQCIHIVPLLPSLPALLCSFLDLETQRYAPSFLQLFQELGRCGLSNKGGGDQEATSGSKKPDHRLGKLKRGTAGTD